MRISGVRTTSLVDGYGLNYVIFCQGCNHHCTGCHNPESWSFKDGYDVTFEDLTRAIEPYIGFITGITFSGGDPAYQIYDVAQVAKWAKSRGLQTTLYTGFQLTEIPAKYLSYMDYVIDGEYIESQKADIPFRGSYNQSIWKQIKGCWYYQEDEK